MEEYDQKVVECIQYLCDCEELSREEKMTFFKKARRALGQTALMLSGGGAIAMYHAGVIRALIKTGLYKYVRVYVCVCRSFAGACACPQCPYTNIHSIPPSTIPS